MEFDKVGRSEKSWLDNSSDLRNVFDMYLNHYKWFLLSILIFSFLGAVKIIYEVPKFQISASILIKENESGNSISDLSAFENMGLLGLGERSLENEIQILKSNTIISRVVNELKLNIQYFIKNNPYDLEIFPVSPIIVSSDENLDKVSTKFKIISISSSEFELINEYGDSEGVKKFGDQFDLNIGDEEKNKSIRIAVELKSLNVGQTIIVKISPTHKKIKDYVESINVEPVNERNSNVLTIRLKDNLPEKGETVINNLIEQYNADGIFDQKSKAQASVDFLTMRISLVATELDVIESSAEQFKFQKGVVDVNAGADLFLESSTLNERELIQANTERELVKFMFDEVSIKTNSDLLPGNIGLTDGTVVSMIDEYNSLVIQRNRVLNSSSELNPIIQNIDNQLISLRENLKLNLSNLDLSLEIRINGLNKERGKISSRIASAPQNEREFNDIIREQEIKNSLYLYLLQKREESIISSAISVEKAKIIDKPFSSDNPISPKKFIVIIVFLIFGFLLPFSIIYVSDILDTKIREEKDLEKLNIASIGSIPIIRSKNKNLLFRTDSDSILAEAFRYVRTNIIFLLDSKNSHLGKTILVTSTLSGEGKTFSAINLACSFANSGSKTVLLGMDLRAPKISNNLEGIKSLGVTNFVKNLDLELSDISQKFNGISNLHVINAGEIGPNPVELLMSDRVSELFSLLKVEYDYIIVDTAPVGMVSDTFQIGKHSDLTLYVIKANSLDKRMLHIPQDISKQNKLSNMVFLLNSCSFKDKSYGYSYGYSDEPKKRWFHDFVPKKYS